MLTLAENKKAHLKNINIRNSQILHFKKSEEVASQDLENFMQICGKSAVPHNVTVSEFEYMRL